MKPFCLTLLLFSAALAQAPPPISPQGKFPIENPDPKLPNGKSQHDAIAKDDYKRNLEDAAQLVKLTTGLKADLEKEDAYVVSVKTIKTTEDIERLARTIRGRLKR